MKTIHLKATPEKLIFDACLSVAAPQPQVRLGVGSCMIYTACRTILHFLWGCRQSERALSPRPLLRQRLSPSHTLFYCPTPLVGGA